MMKFWILFYLIFVKEIANGDIPCNKPFEPYGGLCIKICATIGFTEENINNCNEKSPVFAMVAEYDILMKFPDKFKFYPYWVQLTDVHTPIYSYERTYTLFNGLHINYTLKWASNEPPVIRDSSKHLVILDSAGLRSASNLEKATLVLVQYPHLNTTRKVFWQINEDFQIISFGTPCCYSVNKPGSITDCFAICYNDIMCRGMYFENSIGNCITMFMGVWALPNDPTYTVLVNWRKFYVTFTDDAPSLWDLNPTNNRNYPK